VTIFARMLSRLIAQRPLGRLTIASGLAALAAALLLNVAPAAAVVTSVGPVTVGVQPRANKVYPEAERPKTYANPAGNPVLHGDGDYAIFWDPTDHYWSEWQAAVDGYLEQAGGASGSLATVFAVDAQYTDKSNRPASYSQAYKGSYVDYHAYPTPGCVDPEPFAVVDQIGLTLEGPPTPVCLTSDQIASELEAFIKQNKLPTGLGTVYYLLTPPGVTVCLDGGKESGHCSDYASASEESYENSFCSYHADINTGGLASGDANTIVYAVIPWTAAGGFGDGDLREANDRRSGIECQDDGINPAGKNGYELEEHPDEQQPNQKVPCPDSNGTCDYGLSDLVINQIGLEQQNMVTDPLLNAWQDEHKYENTDECRFLFGAVRGGGASANPETGAGTLYDQVLDGGNYYLNDAFSLAAERLPYPGVPCLNNVNLVPKFTAPDPVNSGETIGFDGMESDIALDAGIGYSSSGTPQPNYATYTWNFGDGTPEVSGYAPGSAPCETPYLSPCAGTEFHSFQYGGTYDVTLTVKDIAGDTTFVTHQVTVNGPPPPSTTTTTTTGGASGAPGSSTTPGAAGSSSGEGAAIPAPVAAAAIVPQKLRSALRKGLLVSYSVNEQVAGRFEVLLGSAIAHRLGISGTPATGLPAGSQPELVIAKAILVTTKAGHSAVHIIFSKRTAARLARAHKVSLMLRLVVRNAAKTNPLTTTVLSNITLG
jgi:PKD domain-containing protein